MIQLVPGTSRGIRLLCENGLPVIGNIAKGEPILAETNIETTHRINKSFFSPIADYLLKVRGDSMKDAGILNGDLLAVHMTPEAFSGQIIVARIDNEVTVKRFYKNDNNEIYLKPENNCYEAIKIDLTKRSFIIEGLAVGVLRTYSTLTSVK